MPKQGRLHPLPNKLNHGSLLYLAETFHIHFPYPYSNMSVLTINRRRLKRLIPKAVNKRKRINALIEREYDMEFFTDADYKDMV